MAKDKTQASTPVEQLEVNPLNIRYNRFAPDELPDNDTRVPLNDAHAALSGIRAIAKIVHASAVEKQSNGSELALDDNLVDGLLQALTLLADIGYRDVEELGEHLFKTAKGGA